MTDLADRKLAAFRQFTGRLILDNGKPWHLEPFQAEIAHDHFAGTRELWVVIPEGNAKTTLTAGFALFHAFATPQASVLIGASTRDQGKIMHDQAGGFVRRTPGLDRHFRVYDGYNRITSKTNGGGRIQVYAADERTGDGVIPTLALLEELHRHKDLRLYRVWAGKLEKRDGQLIAISTAGEPETEFEVARTRLRTESSEVRVEGRHTRAAHGETILHDWALTREDDPDDLSVVKLANPLAAVTIERLARKQRSGAMNRPHWMRFVCNLATRTDDNAVGEQEWAHGRSTRVIPPGAGVGLGLDLGWKWDETALVPLYDEGLPEGAQPPTAAKPPPRLLGPAVTLTPPRDGNSLAPEKVHAAIEELHERNPLLWVAMDMSAGGEQMAAWIDANIGCPIIDIRQSPMQMTEVAERFMESLRLGDLEHVGDPVLTRHVLNAAALLNANGTMRFVRPERGRNVRGQDSRREIDALIAAAMANYAATEQPDDVDPFFDILA